MFCFVFFVFFYINININIKPVTRFKRTIYVRSLARYPKNGSFSTCSPINSRPSSSAPPSAQMRSSAEPVNVVRCINPLYGRERTNISRLALRLLRPADNTNYLHVRKHNIIIYAAGRFIQAHFYSRRSRVAEEESPQKNATE